VLYDKAEISKEEIIMKNSKLKKLTALTVTLLIIVSVFCSCSLKKTDLSAAESDSTGTGNEAVVSLLNDSQVTPDTQSGNTIILEGETATVNGNGAEVKDGTVTITAGGTYTVSGTLKDGRIIVDADGEEVIIVFSNASISCSYSSPLYIYKASKATVYLAEGTKNTLTDSASYSYGDSFSSQTDEEPNSALYSKTDLVIAGSGELTVNANFNNGITSKDTLRIENATLTVNAKNHGINGKDNLEVRNANITVTCSGDALRSTNDTDSSLGYIIIANSDLTLNSGEDGIQAQTYLTISNSDVTVTSGGGSGTSLNSEVSAKGLKAETDITLEGGSFKLDCCDDAVHAGQNITIQSGEFTVSTGDDAIHADNTVTINGGDMTLECHEGIEATVIVINGGKTVINASDDGINAAQKVSGITPRVEINSGEITITMGQGDTDGIDSNGDIIINGGTLSVTGQFPFDYDGTASVNGGTVYANGEKVTELQNQFAGGMSGGGQMQGEPPAGRGQMPDGQKGAVPPGGKR